MQFVVARAPTLGDELFDRVRQLTAPTAVITGATDDVLAAADVALTASGTATVQAALHDTPMVVVYRVSALDYRIFKPFLTVDTYAMVNLIAGDRIVPELIQEAFTPTSRRRRSDFASHRSRASRAHARGARARAREPWRPRRLPPRRPIHPSSHWNYWG